MPKREKIKVKIIIKLLGVYFFLKEFILKVILYKLNYL